MASAFASGKHAFGFCDRCGFRCEMGALVQDRSNGKPTGLRVCQECIDEDQPQSELGRILLSNDPQALQFARPDNTFYAPGNDGAGGSRSIQWGWNPIGGAQADDNGLTPNGLVSTCSVGSVTVVVV